MVIRHHCPLSEVIKVQGAPPYGTIECLFLFCDMSVSSVTDFFLRTALAGHRSEYRVVARPQAP